ncbi:hypothetical protein SAMN04488063_2796 [Halopelagius inordinatus]|uniref:DUF8163 domain-containing protein n=1 Tax=Halopelagius inordinatus TaxID=553467 RepID=A0A1I2U870_9EURY|nr:hypothetical protein [Halopelagius inordinatus]SFG72589.1 hypothetical protein SAMN04488063_2796 [Halopelagius inordinatus]
MSARVRSLFESETDAGLSSWPSTALECLGVGVAASALVLGGGVSGVIAAAGLVVVWVVLPVEYAFATGQVALVVGTEPLALGPFLGVEAGLGLLVAGSLWTADESPAVSAAWLLAYVGLGGGVWYVASEGNRLWYAAAGLWVVVAVSAYVLHRREHVRFGPTEGEHHQ